MFLDSIRPIKGVKRVARQLFCFITPEHQHKSIKKKKGWDFENRSLQGTQEKQIGVYMFLLISKGTWTQEPSGQGKKSSQIRVRKRRLGRRDAIYAVLGDCMGRSASMIHGRTTNFLDTWCITHFKGKTQGLWKKCVII